MEVSRGSCSSLKLHYLYRSNDVRFINRSADAIMLSAESAAGKVRKLCE